MAEHDWLRRLARALLVAGFVAGTGLLAPRTLPPTYGGALTQQTDPSEDPALKPQADALVREGEALVGQGNGRAAIDRFRQALDLYRAAADRAGERVALNDLAWAYLDLGQSDEALDAHQQALELARELGNRAAQARALSGIASVYISFGRYADARDTAQQALAAARASNARRDERIALTTLGTAQNGLGEPTPALEAFESALTIARDINERQGERIALNGIGSAQNQRGEYGAALESLQQALAVAQASQDRFGEATVLIQFGRSYVGLGDYDRALDYYDQALNVARASGQPEREWVALNNLGSVYNAVGEYPRALEARQAALEMARASGNRSGEMSALYGLGQTLNNVGQYTRALEVLQEAVVLARQLGARRGEGSALFQVGLAHHRQGQLVLALEDYQQALARAREAGDRKGEENTLALMAWAYNALGQNRQALELGQRALDAALELGNRRVARIANGSLGDYYANQGEHDRALEYHQQALALAREIRDRRGEWVALHAVGLAYNNLGQSDQALESLAAALAVARETGDRQGEVNAHNTIGTVYNRRGEYARALESLSAALTIARDIGSMPGEATALARSGEAHLGLQDPAAALPLYRQAIQVREDQRAAARLEEFKTSFIEQWSNLYERTALLHLQLGQPAEAFEIAERARARSFLDQLGNTRLDVSRVGDARLVEQERALRNEITALDQQLREERDRPSGRQDVELFAHLGAQLTARQGTYGEIVSQLKLADPEAASLVSVTPLTLAEVQGQLDADTTLLSYFVTPQRTLAFIVRRDDFATVELPVGEQPLRDAINRVRTFGDESAPALAQLSDWLLAPLEGRLTTRAIAIVPHGVLHYLPFAALPEGVGYLGELHTLAHLPSASVLPFIQAKRKAAADRVVALAYSQPAGLPPLRFAEVEAAAIAQLYGTQPLLGGAASKAALRARARESPIVHLAAHGELNQASPLFSRLLLAPDGSDDGSLTVQDVYGLDLTQADLVVLSACATQLGAQSRGDDVVGLNRAFIYAGSPSVIASLWDVNDQATAVLMTAFYRHLRAGMSKAAALQAAQAETRQQYPHPYYWAAFVLTGDPGTAARR